MYGRRWNRLINPSSRAHVNKNLYAGLEQISPGHPENDDRLGEWTPVVSTLKSRIQGIKSQTKGGYVFELEVAGGKAISGLKDSSVAQDLWEILQISPKANELISSHGYKFSMDKQFILHINKTNQ